MHPSQALIKTKRFTFYPGKAHSLAGLEVVIDAPARIERAGPFFFGDKYFIWTKIQEDMLTAVSFEAWALSRLLFLFQQVDSAITIDGLVEFEFGWLRFFLEVHDDLGEIAAELALVCSAYSEKWEGCCLSYPVGREIVAELQTLLAEQPLLLARYEIKPPGRERIGWDGQQFIGQKTLQRSPNFIIDLSLKFRVTERPRGTNTGESGHLVDTWPPLLMWQERTNWSLTHKDCCELDQSKVREHRNQEYIGPGVDYTAGEAFLPNGRALPCVIALTEEDGEPAAIICLDTATIWEIPCLFASTSELTPEQKDRFPLRVVSRLSRSKRNPRKNICITISDRGTVSPWSGDL